MVPQPQAPRGGVWGGGLTPYWEKVWGGAALPQQIFVLIFSLNVSRVFLSESGVDNVMSVGTENTVNIVLFNSFHCKATSCTLFRCIHLMLYLL